MERPVGSFFMVQINSKKRVSRRISQLRRILHVDTQRVRRKMIQRLEEIRQLGKAGWAKYDEMTVNGVQMHFYPKPKRFGGLKTTNDKVDSQVDRFLCSV